MKARIVSTVLAAGLTASSAPAPNAHGAFPGQRGLLAFSQDDQIFTAKEDGTSLSQLTGSGVNRSPSWSADGKALAWTCDDDICVSDADGSNVQRLTGLPDRERRPSWSPDGAWIVFTRQDPISDEVGPYESHLYKLEVSNPENVIQLTDFPSTDPEWSPDGNWIAFLKGWFHYGELWVVRPDGTEARLLNDRNNQTATPSWSPAGDTIAFLGKRRDKWRVCISTLEGKITREFALGKARALGVTWSPDRHRLVFVGFGYLGDDLFVARPDGTHIRRLDLSGRAPDWQPL